MHLLTFHKDGVSRITVSSHVSFSLMLLVLFMVLVSSGFTCSYLSVLFCVCANIVTFSTLCVVSRFVSSLLEEPEVVVTGAGQGLAGSIIHRLFISAQRVTLTLPPCPSHVLLPVSCIEEVMYLASIELSLEVHTHTSQPLIQYQH